MKFSWGGVLEGGEGGIKMTKMLCMIYTPPKKSLKNFKTKQDTLQFTQWYYFKNCPQLWLVVFFFLLIKYMQYTFLLILKILEFTYSLTYQ